MTGREKSYEANIFEFAKKKVSVSFFVKTSIMSFE
jgi:hypothetical protein